MRNRSLAWWFACYVITAAVTPAASGVSGGIADLNGVALLQTFSETTQASDADTDSVDQEVPVAGDEEDMYHMEEDMYPQLTSLLQSMGKVSKPFHFPAQTVVWVFLATGMLCIFMILRATINVVTTDADKVILNSKYPELAAWEQSKIDWLWMGWATKWVAKWGTADDADATKIESDEIPMSNPDDEVDPCFKRFDELWKEELTRCGYLNASLLKVVTRFVTYKKIFLIGFWNAFYEGFMYIGPPLGLKWVTKYFQYLYTQRGLGQPIPENELFVPSLLMILIFCGLPILIAVSNSMCTMLNGRIGIRLDGALSMAVFDKAQRLPLVQDDADDIALVTGQKTKMNVTKPPEDEAFDMEPADNSERLTANNGVSKRFNLVQVVTNDINTNLMAIPNCVARMCVMTPVMCGTLCMLISEIGLAFFFSAAMAILNLALMTIVGLMMRNSLGIFFSTSGRRLQFLQEVVAGIRFVKGCGAENIVKSRLDSAREVEMRSLDAYYTIQCFMFLLEVQMPKLYILASLGGYALFHHQIEPSLIMSILPLLMSVQGAIGVVFSLIPTLVMALPSCRRLETFLKIREAPRCLELQRDGTYRVPPHVKFTQPGEKPVLRLQGDFGWQSFGEPTLRDVDLVIEQGKLTVIVGACGSGKSTLCHALLGELFPSKDGRVELQTKTAFCAQMPNLFEGSLQDNILKGESFDVSRYKEAIYGACLVSDLAALPGGDQVSVGGRGVSLSGGQKARVAMARAAYDTADMVILDDPFAAVDAHTCRHLNDNFLHGPLMRGRTRVAVLQPENDQVTRADWVIVIDDGMIVAQGTAAEVMQTPEYQKLQSSTGSAEMVVEEAPKEKTEEKKEVTVVQKGYELREDECEGRASWATIWYFCRMGGRVAVGIAVFMYMFKNILDMRTQVALSTWMTHGTLYDSGQTMVKPNPWSYILNYMFWMATSTLAWFVCWTGGQIWQLNVSFYCHRAIIAALMRAPCDRFYDKTPTGRIMNRMANDMMNVDYAVWVGTCSFVGMCWSLVVPLFYVHCTMPLWFTGITVPIYYLVAILVLLYWKTMVPLRYLMQVSKSGVSNEIADVEATPATVRAYNMQDYRQEMFAKAVRKMIAADFLGRIVCIRWICNRLFLMGGFFCAGIALLCMWIPGVCDVGSAVLSINTCFGIITMIEHNLCVGSGAQYQLIAMNRIYEYGALPEEREDLLPSDAAFQSKLVVLNRKNLQGLVVEKDRCGHVEVVRMRDGPTLKHRREVLLKELPEKGVLVSAPNKMLADLDPTNEELRTAHKWHRITSANGFSLGAEDMAREICKQAFGVDQKVGLWVESGWLCDGVKVEIQQLRVGYADVPKDVLKGVTITIERHSKAGVVGPTGCGKSTLLLCLLRMLEARAGAIKLEGVDIATLGLRTLRMATGLVPQDPVLLQGSLRFNIDPFDVFNDDIILEALELVNMKEYVEGLPGGLDFTISGEGSNLSFGQRQLLSLARNIVRRPNLLLLDEATSAIDPSTQELLNTTIQKAFPTSTMLVIAHRLETILEFDLCVVLDAGYVIEQGSIRELAERKGSRLSKMLAAKGLSPPPLEKVPQKPQKSPSKLARPAASNVEPKRPASGPPTTSRLGRFFSRFA